MAKFVYKLENILSMKYKLEDQAKQVYGEAVAKLRQEEEVLQQMNDKKIFYENKYRELSNSYLDVFKIKKTQEAIETMKSIIKFQKYKVREAEQIVEKARIKLNAVMIERKTFEKLKENEFEKFKLEINAAESKEIDELVSFKYNSN